MTIQSTGKIKVLAKNVRDGRERNSKFYNLAIMVEGEAGNMSCSEEAYEGAAVDEINDVVYAYNDQYKSFRIISASKAVEYTAKSPATASGSDKSGK